MPQAQTYQSEFTGVQMDERFRVVATLAEALTVLEQAIAAKYTKPASGIPATDLDADVNAALAKANSAIQSLADYYTKSEVDQLLAAINGMDYVDVASLPTASASTMGKIYLVGPDGSGYYSYYFTSYDGSAYSWVGPLGTTEISMANYATKAELSQLDQKVGDVSYQETPATITSWTDVKYIYGKDGSVWNNGANRYATIPVSGAKKVRFLGVLFDSAPTSGFGFYDEDDVCISSETWRQGAVSKQVKEYVVDVPEGATTFKVTSWNTAPDNLPVTINDFYCFLITGESMKDSVEEVKKEANGQSVYYGLETAADTLYALPHIYQGKQLKVPSAGTALSSVTMANADNYRNARVPVIGAERAEYNSYASSYGYGSMFVDADDKVISGHVRITSDPALVVLSVPANAKYFIFGYTVGNSDDFNHITVYFPASKITTEKIADGAVTTPKLADGAVTKEKMAANMGGCFGLTKNLFNPADPDFETGYYLLSDGSKQAQATSAISPFIPITEQIGTLVASVNGAQMNYGGYGICVYDANKQYIGGHQEGTKGYAEWQSGVAYARFTLTNYANGNIQIEQGTTPTAYVAYKFGLKGDALLPGSVNASAIASGAVSSDKLAPDASFPATLPAISLCGLKGESVEEASVSDETITIADWPIYLKSSAIISAEAKITSFDTIYVGVGPAYTRSRFVKIDATNVYFGHGSSTPDAIDKTVAHGLSIGTFIKVIVAIEGLKTTAIISTIDGVFKDDCTRSDVSGNHESYGPPYLKADSSTALTDVKLNANSKQFQRPVWVFGDSMASEFTDRWPYYARYVWGFDFYLDALAGGKSVDLFPDLELALAHGTPKYLLWLLGANDLLDNQSVSYKTYVEQVEALCASHGIELILQKFPSFPEVDPTSINEWIEARGHRVVDFYRATGSDNAGNWYPGYMSNDNRHPSILGAKAEASQVCVDVPEIMQ